MNHFGDIKRALGPELEEMNRIISDNLHTPNKLMNEVVTYYLRIKGKQIRPILVILSAKLFGTVNECALYAGAALEMLHNASLIHDDIVDETETRRGVPTINAVNGNHIAVLVGDYFVSKALSVGLLTGSMDVLGALAALGAELSLGEIDQITNARERRLDEESYYMMIRQKTASLFMSCMRMGARVVGANDEEVARINRFAELLGLSFQIKDDIFDYYSDSEIGKPTGNDLREGKVTLPLIYALHNAPKAEAQAMRQLLGEEELSSEQIETLIEFAKANGGIDYAYASMRKMQSEAEQILATFPDNEARQMLADIFDFIISRSN